MSDLAQRLFDGQAAKELIGDGLLEAGLDDWDSIGGDDYDNSIELYGIGNDVRLPKAAVEFLLEKCGFSKIYVNHKDGWETHYSSIDGPGWRRRYVSDPEAKTTNVIVGEPNPGYFEVSYMPDGFPKAWLESGYMRVVPDPLQPAA